MVLGWFILHSAKSSSIKRKNKFHVNPVETCSKRQKTDFWPNLSPIRGQKGPEKRKKTPGAKIYMEVPEICMWASLMFTQYKCYVKMSQTSKNQILTYYLSLKFNERNSKQNIDVLITNSMCTYKSNIITKIKWQDRCWNAERPSATADP